MYADTPRAFRLYDEVVECKTAIERTQLAIYEVNANIDEVTADLELSIEEKESTVQELTSQKKVLEKDLYKYNKKIKELPHEMTPQRIKFYKIWLYPFYQN